MNEECLKLKEKLFESSKSEFVHIRPLMIEVAFNIIAKTAMGITLDQTIDNVEEFVRCLERILSTVNSRIYNPLNWYDFVFYKRHIGKQMKNDIKLIKHFTHGVINERRINFKPEHKLSTSNRMVFLDLLLTLQSEDASTTDDDICDDVLTFMIAGQHTSSTCLTWTLFLLGIHIQSQQKIIEEVNAIFGDDRDRH
ncbi:putative serine protease K12H4.7-like protein, partial [Leptotrombidium deliense]